jgi:hypothetical protein
VPGLAEQRNTTSIVAQLSSRVEQPLYCHKSRFEGDLFSPELQTVDSKQE